MQFREHAKTTWTALKRWFLVQLLDSLAVGLLWLAGLLLLRVPLAPLWAALGALFQFIPHVGTVLALVGPAVAAGFSGGWTRLAYVLLLYAGIVAADGLLLQPLLSKRTARVPVWASILVPLVLGIIGSFWGVLLAPPILAVVYAYRAKRNRDGKD